MRGQPLRFCRGHGGRKADYVVEDRGFASPCWIWTKSYVGPYGQCHVDRHPHLAHRVYYERHVGPIADGLTIDHLCRQTGCVNPSHMEPVPMTTNIRRGSRTTLTVAEVREIRSIGHASDELAAHYGVSKWTLYDVLRRRSWAEVT